MNSSSCFSVDLGHAEFIFKSGKPRTTLQYRVAVQRLPDCHGDPNNVCTSFSEDASSFAPAAVKHAKLKMRAKVAVHASLLDAGIAALQAHAAEVREWLAENKEMPNE